MLCNLRSYRVVELKVMTAISAIKTAVPVYPSFFNLPDKYKYYNIVQARVISCGIMVFIKLNLKKNLAGES